MVSDDVIDIFGSAGLKLPDVSILADEFLEDVKHMPQRNLALELLGKLHNDEIRSRTSEPIDIAKAIRDANSRVETLGLSEDELAFYAVLAQNGTAIRVMGDKRLAIIASRPVFRRAAPPAIQVVIINPQVRRKLGDGIATALQ